MAWVYGIDTGSYRTRKASFEGSFRRFVLKEVAEAPSAEVDERPDFRESLPTLIAQEPSWEAGMKVASFPLEQGNVFTVRLPFSDRSAIERTLPSEVESTVPYNLDEMLLQMRILEAREGQSRTLTLVTPKDALRARLAQLESLKCAPATMCFDVDALASYADRGTQVILDIGHRRTVLAVCVNGALIAGRYLPMGGAALTEAIVAVSGATFADAEAWKHAASILGQPLSTSAAAEWTESPTDAAAVPRSSTTTDPLRALTSAADAWIIELRATLLAVEDGLGVGIDELLVCGGGSLLGGLKERLADALGIPVRPVLVPGGQPVTSALAVALGRAGAGELKISNLRVGEFTYHGEAELIWNVLTWTTAGVVMAGLAGVLLFGFQYYDASQRIAELDEQIAAAVTEVVPTANPDVLKNPGTALEIMRTEAALTSQRIEDLGFLTSDVPPTVDLLKTLSDRMPAPGEARIDVRELSLSSTMISFKAETDSYDSAAKIEESLKQNPQFNAAQKGDEKKSGEALTFSVNIPLGGSEEDAPATGKEG